MSKTLDIDDLIKDFAKRNTNVPHLKFITEKPDGVEVEDITGVGCINRVFLLRSRNDKSQSVVIKYGEETWDLAKVLGDSLSLERQDIEFYSLKLLHGILPGCVPQPYFYDKQLHMIAMEDLTHLKLYGPVVREHGLTPELAARFGKLLGKIHHQTHRSVVSEGNWKEMVKNLKPTQAKEMVMEYRLERVYDEQDEGIYVPEHLLPYHKKVAEHFTERKIPDKLKELYLRQDCFVHSDLHNYSWFISEDRIAIIDPEFASIGNPAADFAFAMVAMYFCHFEAQGKMKMKVEELRQQNKEAMKAFVESYISGYEGNIAVLGDWEKFVSEFTAFVGATCMSGAVFAKLDTFIILTDHQREYAFRKGADILNKSSDVKSMETFFEMLFADEHEDIMA